MVSIRKRSIVIVAEGMATWMKRPARIGSFRYCSLLFAQVCLLVVLTSATVFADPVEKAVSRLNSLYQAGGPAVGCLLYEPCFVLALADLRPVGAWAGNPILPEEVSRVEALDRIAKEFDCSIQTYEGQLTVLSLAGLELTSSETTFAWAEPPYKAETGWSGWNEWFRSSEVRAERLGLKRLDDYIEGLRLGYPDTAIRGYIGQERDLLRHARSVSASIRYADFLTTGEPDFDLLPEDVLAEDIERVVMRWGDFLCRFYTDPRVRELITSEEFLQARRAKRPDFVNGRNEMWMRRDHLSDKRLFSPRREDRPTREDELVLTAALGELEESVARGEPPYEWVLLLQRQAFRENRRSWITPELLREWIWLGGLGLSPHRLKLFEIVDEQSPELVEALLHQRIKTIQKMNQESTSYRQEALMLFQNRAYTRYAPSLSEAERQFVDQMQVEALSW